MPETAARLDSSESTDMDLFIKLAAALTGLSEAALASAVDPLQVIDSWFERFGSWSAEPLRLADFVA